MCDISPGIQSAPCPSLYSFSAAFLLDSLTNLTFKGFSISQGYPLWTGQGRHVDLGYLLILRCVSPILSVPSLAIPSGNLKIPPLSLANP